MIHGRNRPKKRCLIKKKRQGWSSVSTYMLTIIIETVLKTARIQRSARFRNFGSPIHFNIFALLVQIAASFLINLFKGLKSLPVIKSRLIRLWIPFLNDENDSIKGCCQADYVEGHLDNENIINISALFGLFFEIVYCILILDKMNFGLFLKKFQVHAVSQSSHCHAV